MYPVGRITQYINSLSQPTERRNKKETFMPTANAVSKLKHANLKRPAGKH